MSILIISILQIRAIQNIIINLQEKIKPDIIETKAQYTIESQEGDNLNILIVIENDNGIEEINIEELKIEAKGKKKVALDRTMKSGYECEVNIKVVGEPEKTYNLLAISKPNIVTEVINYENRGIYTYAKVEYPNNENIYKQYSLDKGETWNEYAEGIDVTKALNVSAKCVSKKENAIQCASFTNEKVVNSAIYGQKVKYIANGVEGWRVFYFDEEGNTFIIKDSYLLNTKIPSGAQMARQGTYRAYWIRNNEPNYIETSEETRKKFMVSWDTTSKGRCDNCVYTLLNTSIWSPFANGVSNEKQIYNSIAIGSLTLEMLVDSWNQKSKDYKLTVTKNDKDLLQITHVNLSGSITYKETPNAYFPIKIEQADGCESYLLATPKDHTQVIYAVEYDGYVDGSELIHIYARQRPRGAVRPVICIPSNYNLHVYC